MKITTGILVPASRMNEKGRRNRMQRAAFIRRMDNVSERKTITLFDEEKLDEEETIPDKPNDKNV